MSFHDHFHDLSQIWDGSTSRRSLIVRSAAFAASIPTVSTLLAACGGDDDDDDQPAGEATTDEAADEPTDEPADEPTDEPAADDAVDRVLVLRNRGEIVNMDIAHSSGNPDNVLYHNIYSRLIFQIPGENELTPDLATDWEISDDGTEFTFSLREGVQWHKGYGDVTAHDVKWTFDRMRAPETASRYAPDHANVDEVSVIDDHTVRITLKTPDPTFTVQVLGQMGGSGYVMNERALEEKGDTYSSDPVGSGPYIFERWSPGEECEIVRNDGHWLLHPDNNINRAIFKFLLDDSIVELALRSGDLDVAYVETPETQVAVLDNAALQSSSRPAPRTYYVVFGPFEEDHPLSDVRFRQALSLAIDRELLTEEVIEGMGVSAHTIFNPGHFGYVDKVFFPFDYDPEEARRLVEESGYDGRTIELHSQVDLLTNNVGTVLLEFWREVGIDVEYTVLERALFVERYNQADYEMAYRSHGAEWPEGILFPLLTSDGIPAPNASQYTGVDDLAEQLRPEFDLDRRAEILLAIQEKVAEDAVMIPVLSSVLVIGFQPHVQIHHEPGLWFYPVWLMSMD